MSAIRRCDGPPLAQATLGARYCGRPTRDKSGKCNLHRVAVQPALVKASR